MNLFRWMPNLRINDNNPVQCNRVFPIVEELEARTLPAPIPVINTADAGPGSFRAAIIEANNKAGADEIEFKIGPGVQEIILDTKLPIITDKVTIDATPPPFPQPFHDQIIKLTMGQNQLDYGLRIGDANGKGGSSSVKGLVIGGGFIHGIHIHKAGNNTISNNFIGTDETGQKLNGNKNNGVFIESSAGNTIGGSESGTGNLISGSGESGVYIKGDDADGNFIQRNIIGTDIDGQNALSNAYGVFVEDGDNNEIGGNQPEYGNLISGNEFGVIVTTNGDDNLIQNNLIGTSILGNQALPNRIGVRLALDTTDDNYISDNVISGNEDVGVSVSFAGDNNSIVNNKIGTDILGTTALPNGTGVAKLQDKDGIRIRTTSNLNVLGNVISGNIGHGIIIIGREDDDATNNIFSDNIIGLDSTGQKKLGNGEDGIRIEGGGKNLIGRSKLGGGNVISGNTVNAISVMPSDRTNDGGTGNQITGNFIGTDKFGGMAIPNGGNGLWLVSKGSIVGDPTNPQLGKNIIAWNVFGGVHIDSLPQSQVNSGSNIVIGNEISRNGLDGILAINDQGDNQINSNVIWNNGDVSTNISVYSNGNEIQGNYVGVDQNGKVLGGYNEGIFVAGTQTVIGGLGQGEGNTIGGQSGWGIWISNIGQATVTKNSIGETANSKISNSLGGIRDGGTGSVFDANLIGYNDGPGVLLEGSGASVTENTIRGNQGDGVRVSIGTGHAIKKNYIYSNSELGIDLVNPGDLANGVTVNDVGDGDGGPNLSQNYPVLTGANVNAQGQVVVSGTIDSLVGNSAYPITIEFFGNIRPDPSGHGEGRIYLGSVAVNQPGAFAATVPFAFFITATATDSNANTSEFSQWIQPNPLPGFGIIGNWVWADTNRNGTQDPEEVGLPNVTVELRDTFNTVVATTTSDTDGQYFFPEVTPGDYTLKFIAPTGYGFTTKDAGSDDALDSDADVFGVTDVFTISDGQTITDLDAGLTLTTIGDFVWHDLDSDGIQEAGEPGLEDVVVSLYEYFGGALVASTTTDATGYYEFTGVADDDYFLVFDPVNLGVGYEFTQMDAGTDEALDSDADPFGTTMPFIVAAGQLRDDLDAGLIDTSGSGTGSIGDYVWDDVDEDGIQDPEEQGLPGVTVTLEDDQGGWAQATVTDITGYYSFDNLAAGTYTLEFTAPQDYDFTLQHQGGDPTLDSDVDPVTGKIPSITLTAGEVLTDLDAGLVFSPSGSGAYIGDFVWDDVDQDGIQDVGETGLQGIVVRLFDFYTGLEVASTVSDINGHYSFSNVAAGEYYLQIDKPMGMAFTLQDQGGDDTLDSDVDVNGITALFSLLGGEIKDDLDAGLYWLP